MTKSKVTKNIRQINLSDESNGWKVFSTQENVEKMQKMGLMVGTDKQLTLKDKIVLEDSDGKLHIMKKNTFCPHTEKLDISTAVGEKVWDIAIDAVSVNESFSNLRNMFLPVTLNSVKTVSSKGDKLNEKICSSTVYQEDYHDRGILQAYHPELFEKLDTKSIPENLRVFSILIGKAIKASDILFNKEGKVIAIDNADANPFKIQDLIDTKFYSFLESLNNQEEAIRYCNIAKDLSQELLGNVDNIIKDMYDIYDKVNIEKNPSEKNRVSGLRLYEHIWNQIPKVMDVLISKIKGEDVAFAVIDMKPIPVATIKETKVVKEKVEKVKATKAPKITLKPLEKSKPLKNTEILELIDEEEVSSKPIEEPVFNSELFEEELVDI